MNAYKIIYYTCGAHVIVLQPGKYLLEIWGAEGGGDPTLSCYGGKGAYAKGTINLFNYTTIYANIGEYGNAEQINSCNGGGASLYRGSGSYSAKSGGGSTDIRIGNDSINYRVLVAGGGGGAGICQTCGKGGDAGGILPGNDGECSTHSSCNEVGGGATNISGGKGTTYGSAGDFYFGGNNSHSNQIGGGGGSGWYGGGAGNYYGSGGGGGSSYAFDGSSTLNQMLDAIYKLDKITLLAGNERMPSSSNANEFEIGHSGNGAIRITYISNENEYLQFNFRRIVIILFFFVM